MIYLFSLNPLQVCHNVIQQHQVSKNWKRIMSKQLNFIENTQKNPFAKMFEKIKIQEIRGFS
jgi:hypothetical protein